MSERDSPCLHLRADCNSDVAVDISDVVFALEALFIGGLPTCVDACDSNDDAQFDVSDPVYLLANLFTGGDAPPPPFPDCGSDPSVDSLACSTPPLCP